MSPHYHQHPKMSSLADALHHSDKDSSMREISPLADLGTRPPEAGRIRMGVKTEKAMKSIDTFRFTSPDEQTIRDIAALYGGTARPWKEPRANPSNQYEVITTSDEIRVMLVPDGISVWYELWAGSGIARRCDGIDVQCPVMVGRDWEMGTQPCLCRAENKRQCKPHTRLQLVLPEVAFRGVWRLETQGWNAMEELPGMFNLITGLADQGRMVDAVLSVERRERVTPAGKRNFVVPRLAVRQSVDQLVSTSQVAVGGPSQVAIGPAPMVEVVEAEILDDELLEIEALLKADAAYFGLDPDMYVAAVKAQAEGDRVRMRACSTRVRAGDLAAKGFKQGKIEWIK